MKKTCHECKHSFGSTFSKCPRGELSSKAFAKRAETICHEFKWADKRLEVLENALSLLTAIAENRFYLGESREISLEQIADDVGSILDDWVKELEE